MKGFEHKIGATMLYNKKKVTVVARENEDDCLYKCVFQNMETDICRHVCCTKDERKDGKNVYYEKN
jgi:hypothetical protein